MRSRAIFTGIAALTVAVAATITAVSVPASAAPARTTPSATARALNPPPPAVRSAARTALAGPAAPSHSAIPRVDPDVSANAAGPTVSVTVHGESSAVASATRRLGGTVLAATADAVSVTLPTSRLSQLAAASGVTRVARSVKAWTTGVTSQGVTTSGANVWHSAGKNGAGVKVAIVDAGFQGLTTEVAAGNLRVGQTVAGNYCGTALNSTDHGTGVAEIVHQMAPSATLYLYCVQDSVGFAQAATALRQQGVTIVNSSLGFPGDSRGDGTGPAGSTAQTVATARRAGVLWIQSAGNNGLDHWGGTLARSRTTPSLVALNPADSTPEVDMVQVYPNATGAAVLQWDGWPTSKLALQLRISRFDLASRRWTAPVVVTHPANAEPVLEVNLPSTSSSDYTLYSVAIGLPGGTVPALHYDLSYWGEVSYSDFASRYPNAAGRNGSITEPASSPYVLAVGAADATGAGACDPSTSSAQRLEPYSSRGPTVDGRTKPDILGYDATISNRSDLSPFCGTSAAAPHVAGAAALVKAANPALDAAQIQALLQTRAGAAVPSNSSGHGLLKLGATTGVTARTGSGYVPLASQRRILDTRTATGGHKAPLGTRGTVTVATGVPAGARAVAVNLTGLSTSPTYLSVYPGPTVPTTSTVNLSRLDSTAASFAIVTLSAARTITVRNNAGRANVIVDVLGYFADSSTNRYAPRAPTRILDTRTGVGGHTGRLRNQSISVPVGVTSGSVLVNLTATGMTAPGYFALSPAGPVGARTSTVNLSRYDRANLAVVKVGPAGTIRLTAVGSAHAVIDLVGTFNTSGTSVYVALPSAVRIVDTRTGNGGRHASLGRVATQVYVANGVGEIPYTARSLMTNVTAISTSGASYVTVYAYGRARPRTSTLNVTAGRTVPNAAATATGSLAFSVYNNAGVTAVAVDLVGYFT